jgi:hypothetical protein
VATHASDPDPRPATLAGLVEIRGRGIIRVDALEEASSVSIVNLTPSGALERPPEPQFGSVLDLAVPLIALTPIRSFRGGNTALCPAGVCGSTGDRYNGLMIGANLRGVAAWRAPAVTVGLTRACCTGSTIKRGFIYCDDAPFERRYRDRRPPHRLPETVRRWTESAANDNWCPHCATALIW